MKKRLLSILLAVVLVLSLLPVISVFAASYDLIICGIEVTDANKDNIRGDGHFKFDPSTKTLTVSGDTSYAGGIVIDNGIDGLTIKSSGTNVKITASGNDVVFSRGASLTFKDAHMNIECYASGCAAVSMGASTSGTKTLSFNNCDMFCYTNSEEAALWGDTRVMLDVNNSSLNVQGAHKAVDGFKGGIKLTRCYVDMPEDAIYDGDAILDSSRTVAAHIKIFRGEKYQLWIDGTQVDGTNKTDVLGDGRFSYDDYSNTLTVKKATSGPDPYKFSGNEPTIKSRIDGLTITTDPGDDNQITLQSNAEAVIESINANLNISGANLKLIVKNNDDACVYMDVASVKKTLSIEYSDLVLKGDYGLAGETAAALLVNESTVDADNNKGGVCSFYKGIQLQNCAIMLPEKSEIDSGDGEIRDAETHDRALHVLIEPTYGFKVGGKEVTKGNASDILGDGAFSYDDDSRTLTIKGNYKGSVPAVNNLWVSNLHINIANDVMLENTSGNDPVLRLRRHTILEGSGKLTLKADSGFGIYAFNEEAEYKTRVILKNVDLTVNAKYGIYASSSGITSLEITESSVKVSATEAAIKGFVAIKLTTCAILKPEGGDIAEGTVVEDDGDTALEVEIGLGDATVYDLSVGGEKVTDLNKDNLAGGAASYDPETKTLTVIGDISSTSGSAIDSAIDGLIVDVSTDASFSCEVDGLALKFGRSTTLTGTGSITTVNGNTAIKIFSGDLTIDGITVHANAYTYGIVGGGGTHLKIKSAEVVTSTVVAEAISGFLTITLDGCSIQDPADGAIKDGAIVDKEGSIAKYVEIVPETAPIITCNVMFDVNGHGTAPADQVVELGKTATKPEAPSEEGWKFEGWFTDKACTAAYDFAAPVTADLTLFAKWTEDAAPAAEFTVTFDANGHGTAPAAEKVEDGKTAAKPADPSEEGWKFEGWFTDKACTAAYDFAAPVTADLTLFAKWTEDAAPAAEFTVTFDANGHGTAPAAEKVEDGKTAAKPADPSEEGWKFEGWFTDKECTKAYDFAAPVTADLTLFAKWTKEEGGELVNPFVDVFKTDYFYDAVLWAYYHTPYQVTNGIDATHFGPANTCTRGQIVTFLWRALGQPEPTIEKNPFVDVKESDYYYKAVLWAFEKGVTTGTDESHFAPNDFCKREHAVAFLYRAAGKPEYTNKTNPFGDVASSAYYYDAVLWAVEKNITKGIDANHFGPSNSCLRSQIVTFLYRFMNP